MTEWHVKSSCGYGKVNEQTQLKWGDGGWAKINDFGKRCGGQIW
jgi:hypothetical protein